MKHTQKPQRIRNQVGKDPEQCSSAELQARTHSPEIMTLRRLSLHHHYIIISSTHMLGTNLEVVCSNAEDSFIQLTGAGPGAGSAEWEWVLGSWEERSPKRDRRRPSVTMPTRSRCPREGPSWKWHRFSLCPLRRACAALIKFVLKKTTSMSFPSTRHRINTLVAFHIALYFMFLHCGLFRGWQSRRQDLCQETWFTGHSTHLSQRRGQAVWTGPLSWFYLHSCWCCVSRGWEEQG